MATEKAPKGPWAKFMHWYGSYNGKNIVNIIYSVGASVVIIGALFKILHWPGASTVLMIGMFTEAFLFIIGALDHPHPEFHWENVFPQLLEFGTEPGLLEEKSHQARPTLLGAGVAGGAPLSGIAAPAAPAAPAAAPAEPAKLQSLKEDEMKALKEGMAELAKTATQFAELGKVADKGVKLGEKMAAAEQAAEIYASKISAAGTATDSYAAATANLAQNYALISNDIANVAEQTRAYKQSVNEVGQKLASLNSVYELQLQAVNAQVEAQKHVTAATKEAADAQLAFANGAKQLQKQVTDLNGIYGNMLNALA
jgi:gliding motility-associated protein GldL